MFYVKSSFGYTDVITELHYDNIFTRCPKCGRELNVDLAEVFLDGDADLETTSIVCSACAKKRIAKEPCKLGRTFWGRCHDN